MFQTTNQFTVYRGSPGRPKKRLSRCVMALMGSSLSPQGMGAGRGFCEDQVNQR
jgi:hypothetical protein